METSFLSAGEAVACYQVRRVARFLNISGKSSLYCTRYGVLHNPLAATIPALKTLSKALGKKLFFKVVGLAILDIKLGLLAYDKALDQFRGIHPQVRIQRPPVVVVSAPCTSAALTAAIDAHVNQPGGWKVLGYACHDGYAFASINPVTGGMQAVAVLQQQGSAWKVLYGGEGLCLPPGQNQSMCQGYKQPMPIALLESLMRQAGYLH